MMLCTLIRHIIVHQLIPPLNPPHPSSLSDCLLLSSSHFLSFIFVLLLRLFLPLLNYYLIPFHPYRLSFYCILFLYYFFIFFILYFIWQISIWNAQCTVNSIKVQWNILSKLTMIKCFLKLTMIKLFKRISDIFLYFIKYYTIYIL